MCGIVGVFLLNAPSQVPEERRRCLAYWLHNELLYHTAKRGKDATGFAVSYTPPEGSEDAPFWLCVKQPVKANDFFNNDGSDSRYAGQDPLANIEAMSRAVVNVPQKLNAILGHTRAMTIGTELNPNNNHPVLIGNIIGVHNGGVTNHSKIFEKHEQMTRIGEVDSEAIMQLLAENANERELGWEDINFVSQRIIGPRAVIAFNRLYPNKVIFFRDHARPIEVNLIPELGLLFLYSEREFMEETLASYRRLWLLNQHELPKLSVISTNILTDEGGVIDLTNEYTSEVGLQKFLQVKKYETKILDGYDFLKSSSTTSSSSNIGTGSNNDSHVYNGKGYQGAGTSTETSAMVTTTPAKEQNKVDVLDLSDYPEEEEGNKVKTVSENSIMGDEEPKSGDATMIEVEEADESESSAEEEETEEGELLYFGEYTIEDVQKKALDFFTSEDCKGNPNMLFNRNKNYRLLVNIQGVTADNAEEVVQSIYPEAFNDGFQYGVVWGHDLHAERVVEIQDEVEQLQGEKEALEKEVKELRALLKKDEGKTKRAANILANLKGAFTASMVFSQMFKVDEASGQMTLDENFCNYVRNSGKFEHLKLEDVLNLYHKNDIHRIDEETKKLSPTAGKPSSRRRNRHYLAR